jgi:energy-coupling factor transport system permease protein
MQKLQLSPSQRKSRWVHPLAWWGWGISTAIAAMLSGSLAVHALIFVGVLIVLLNLRSNGSWANAVTLLLRLALFIVLFRIFIELIFGVHFGGIILLTLPTLDLPVWLGGISVGGKVGLTGMLAAFAHGFKLATVIVAAAAPAVLVPPNLLLKSLPNAIYEAGLVTVIALGFLPALSADAKRIKTAAALRGRPAKSLRQQVSLLFPLMESSLSRAVTLANAMESKGFGQTKPARFNPLTISFALITGLLLLLLSSTSLLRNPANSINSLLLVTSLALIIAAVILSGKIKVRSIYRKLEFDFTELVLAAVGLALIVTSLASYRDSAGYAVVAFFLVASPIAICPKPPIGFNR